jgi:hypothetical protein
MNGGKKNLAINPQIVKKNEPMIDETGRKLALELKVPNGFKTKEPKTSIHKK